VTKYLEENENKTMAAFQVAQPEMLSARFLIDLEKTNSRFVNNNNNQKIDCRRPAQAQGFEREADIYVVFIVRRPLVLPKAFVQRLAAPP
jgi:hypothetical protein